MYADYHLDSAPPRSQYRRPWSPEPYDPRPDIFVNDNHHNDYPPQRDFDPYVPEHLDHDHGYSRFPPIQQEPQRSYHGHGHGHGQREASDVSVEALDLADYARTLQRRQEAIAADPYPAHYPQTFHPPPGSQFPPSPPRSYYPPSAMSSRPPTRSSNSHASSSRPPQRRPISLPPPSMHASSSRSSNPSRTSHWSRQSRQAPPVFQEPPDDAEIDVSQFPAFTRGWYKAKSKPPPSAFPANFPTSSQPDLYNSIPNIHGDSTKRSPFDPGYINQDPYDPWGSQPGVDPYEYAPTYQSHESSRKLLPWNGGEPPDFGSSLDPAVKEERVRMLEREFAKKPKQKGGESDFLDENGKPMIGTVDEKGYLVTPGPKRRMLNRMLQIAFAATASIPAIYAAVAIKYKEPPPPAGKPAAYVLYVVSTLSLFFLLYLFLFRPCCCGPRRKAGPDAKNPLAANGMMVLPVQGLPGMQPGKKKGKHKGKKGMIPGMGDVQVNLIVDPSAFGNQRQQEEEESDEGGDWDDEWDGLGSGTGGSSSGRRKRRQQGQGQGSKRRSVFAGLAMEEDWKKARRWAKNVAVVDVFGMILWGAVFVYVMMGKRCPSGGFEGWCNAYNTSTAAACLLCVSFGVSIFFDIQDLSASKASPRTR